MGGMFDPFAKMNDFFFFFLGIVELFIRLGKGGCHLLISLILLEASLSEVEIRANGRSKNANNKLVFSNNTML